MAQGKKKLGVDLPPEVVEMFQGWCDARGLSRASAVTAALKLLLVAPLWLREAAMSQDGQSVAAAMRLLDEAWAARAIRESVDVEPSAPQREHRHPTRGRA